MTDPTPSTPVTIRDQMQMVSEGVRGSSNHTLSTIWTKLDTLETSIDELKAQVTLLQEGLGASPYQALTLTTTRGLLYAILGRLTTLADGRAPDAGTGEYVSSGETIFDGRRYALFPNDIPNVTISSDRRELTQPTWEGWEFYIQTNDPSPWANGIPTVPGIWAPFGPFTTWNFSTAAQYAITVYLRVTGEAEFEYFLGTSAVYSTSGVSTGIHASVWPSGFTVSDRDFSNVVYNPAVYLADNANGWQFQLLTGSDVSMQAFGSSLSEVIYNGPLSNSWATISGATTKVALVSAGANGPFTFRFRRPIA